MISHKQTNISPKASPPQPHSAHAVEASVSKSHSAGKPIPASVRKTPLLREPRPCHPAAETAIQPQIRCFQS